MLMRIVTSCRRNSYTFEAPVLRFWILPFAFGSRLLLQNYLGLYRGTDTACKMHGWIMMVTAVGPLRVCLGGWLQPWPIGTLLDPGPACTSDLNGHRYGVIVFFDFCCLNLRLSYAEHHKVKQYMLGVPRVTRVIVLN